MAGALRILVVDDHTIIHETLRRILADVAPQGVECTARTDAALRAFEADAPCVTIVDLGLPDSSGLSLIRKMLQQKPAARVVALADACGAVLAAQAMQAGAMAVARKSDPPDMLVTCVRNVLDGKTWMPGDLQQQVALMKLTGADGQTFSTRELAVLRALAYGDSLGEIAHNLDISYKTVTNEVAQLREKLKARTQPEMIRIAMERKLIS